MNYLLDTSTVVAIMRNRPLWARQRYQRAGVEGALIAVSCIVLFELWYGIARSQRRQDEVERLRLFLSGDITVVPFEHEDAAEAGELRAQQASAGTPIGPYDVLIAGQARRLGATLVTANVSEFSRVPGLRWEDWTATGA